MKVPAGRGVAALRAWEKGKKISLEWEQWKIWMINNFGTR
jgi:hypothetical protein